MNLPPSLLLICLGLLVAARADVPVKHDEGRYASLWKSSPFTARPVTEGQPVVNVLSNYVLLGVSPIPEGYRVTLKNKRQPNDPPIVVKTNKPASGFRIEEVIFNKAQRYGTIVRMSVGGMEGTVQFDAEFLKNLRPPPTPPAAQAQAATNINSGAAPVEGGGNTAPPRPSRMRVVPPPAAQGSAPAGQTPSTPTPPTPPGGGGSPSGGHSRFPRTFR